MFDAGAIQAHLDVELAAFDRKLTQAEERVKRFENERHEVKIEAKLDSSSINQARQAFTRLDQQVTRDAVQRARTSPQGSLLGTLASMTSAKSGGGKVAAGLGQAPLLLSAGMALAPALATLGGVGVGAGIAGGGALAAAAPAAGAFAAIAKPVLAQALAAEQQVKKAQDAYNQALATGADRAKSYAAEQQAIAKAYTGMSPAQRELSRQLGVMAENWDKVKQKETPVVAGALQPWLRSISDLMTKLHPIIVAVSGVVGSLGKEFDVLIDSPAFTGFRNFIAGTGSLVIGSAGRSVLDIMHGLMVLLPQFAPLIEGAARGAGHLADKFEAWAVSDKARTDVSNFLKWFKENGPTVGRFIQSIASAVAALAPGLAAGGALEIQVLTTFLNLIAKLPKGVAGPLTEIAGAALILAKLPGGQKVISFSVNLVGKGASALLKWMTGGAIDIGGGATAATEIRTAMVSGGAAAAESIRLAMVSGGATAAGEEATGLAGAGAAAGTAASGGFLTALAASPGLPLIGGIIAGELIKQVGDSLNKPGSTGAAAAAGFRQTGAPGATITGGWVGALAGWLGIGGGDGKKSAVSAMNDATSIITGDFAKQGKAAVAAKADLDTYTNTILTNDKNSLTVRFGRAQLITDMVNAGVKATVAQADVDAYTTAVQHHSTTSDQVRSARRRLITDILDASSNSQQGKTDLGIYTSAVKSHSLTSDQVRGARQRLITDLVNAGVDAKTAAGLVDGLGGSIKKLPAGKTITIKMVGTGDYTVRQTALSGAPGTFAPGSGGVNAISKGAASGMYIAQGTGPRADDVLIRASKGEFVQQASAVSHYGVPAMHAVNEGRAVIGYATGGTVGSGHTENLTPGFVGGMYNDFQQKFGQAMVNSMFAALKKAESTGSAADVLAYAMSFLHKAPYVWGGNTPAGWDCSGFVEYVLKRFGLGMAGRPTAASFQGWATPSGPVPGGLAFYGTPAHHIGFVVNGNTLLSALGRNYGTTLSSLNMGDNAGYGVPPMGYGHLGAGPGGGLPIGKIQELAYTLLTQRGWGNQWGAFSALEMSEAGWRLDAKNPTSPAYGMAQFIGGAGDYAKYGGSWLTAQGQLTAMLNYIAQRYPSGPAQAWAFHQRNNYYDKGGPINEPVIGFGTRTGQQYTFGENGREWVTPGDKPPGGAMIGSVTIQLPDGQSVSSALTELNFWLNVAQQQGYMGVLPGG